MFVILIWQKCLSFLFDKSARHSLKKNNFWRLSVPKQFLFFFLHLFFGYKGVSSWNPLWKLFFKSGKVFKAPAFQFFFPAFKNHHCNIYPGFGPWVYGLTKTGHLKTFPDFVKTYGKFYEIGKGFKQSISWNILIRFNHRASNKFKSHIWVNCLTSYIPKNASSLLITNVKRHTTLDICSSIPFSCLDGLGDGWLPGSVHILILGFQ